LKKSSTSGKIISTKATALTAEQENNIYELIADYIRPKEAIGINLTCDKCYQQSFDSHSKVIVLSENNFTNKNG
jgi:hypothetical protein